MESLCKRLIESESEIKVVNHLKKAGYWDNFDDWKFYGDNENNFSIIGNQQSLPESAIVEKLINSVDAMLMRECLRNRIDPEGSDAPNDIFEAQNFFLSALCLADFNIRML